MSTPRGWARPNPGKRSNILAHTPRPLAPEHGGKQDSEPDPSSPPSSRPSPNSLLFFAAKASPPLPEFPRANPIPDGAIGTVPHSNCPIFPTFGHRGRWILSIHGRIPPFYGFYSKGVFQNHFGSNSLAAAFVRQQQFRMGIFGQKSLSSALARWVKIRRCSSHPWVQPTLLR